MSTEARQGIPTPAVYEVISSVGNHEVKGLVLGAMQADVPYSQSHLYSELMALQGNEPAWKINKSQPLDYCVTFAGVGLVAEETVGANADRAYRLTDRGRLLAKPLVGHLLDLSLNQEPSLVEIFGPTQTNAASGVRPSQRRTELMRFMLENEGQVRSMAEACKAVGVNMIAHASMIAEDVAAAGIITWQSSGRGKPTITFTAGERLQHVKLRRDAKPLMLDTLDLAKKHFAAQPGAALSNEDIAKMLLDTGKYDQPLSRLIKQVSNKTNQFTQRNVLRAKRYTNDANAREIIEATPDQLELMAKIVTIVDGIQHPADDYLEKGHELLNIISSDPDLVNHLVQKAKDNSLGRKGIQEEQTIVKSIISKALATSDAPLSIREVQGIVHEAGIYLDRKTVDRHLGVMFTLGGLAVTETAEGQKFSSTRPAS